MYARVVNSIMWEVAPPPPPKLREWLVAKEAVGSILKVYHITQLDTLEATVYKKEMAK